MVLKNIKSKKGFTIVELLVVIVVIGILAAITIVSYSGITSRANNATNKSNAHNVISAAEAVRADTSIFPAPTSVLATMTTNLNAGVAKIPSSLLVSGQYTGQSAQTPVVVLPTSSNGAILYVTNNATIASATGICVYYYDNTVPGVASLTSGNATAAANPATAAAATCS